MRVFGSLIVGAFVIYAGLYAWQHHPPFVAPGAEEQTAGTETNGTPLHNRPFVKVTGPLADYVTSHMPTREDAEKPRLKYKPTAQDHIEDSPVGSSSRIVQKTFAMARVAQFPFEVPPHAATPHFHGTFKSFVQQVTASGDDNAANVELLLMNEAQYAEFSNGREPDVLFASDASHYQDINFELSPSQAQPVKYHLIFRSAPGGAPKKVVQADFAVDF